jgi:hypothetical protein
MKDQITAIACKISPELSRLIVFICMGLLVFTAFDFQYAKIFREERILTDFDAFYLSGRMFWDGTIDKAYNYKEFFEAQKKLYDASSFMPWSYPPQFDLITAGLSTLPIGLAYLVFSGMTMALYFFVIRLISPGYLGSVLLVVFPAVIINIRSGQNGFLTGAIAGLFFLTFMRRSSLAGIPLGLMIIKPHLAVGMTVLTLVSKRWSIVGGAALTVIISTILATIILGSSIWLAFAEGIKATSYFLELGAYPMFRMSSVYATLHKFGIPPTTALAIQLFVAAIACSAIVIAFINIKSLKSLIGVTAIASLFVSPYNYDYDLTLLGLAAAALLPDIATRARPFEIFPLLLLSWISCGWGLLISGLAEKREVEYEIIYIDPSYALSSIALVLLTVWTLHIIKRSPRTQETESNVQIPAQRLRSS